MTPPKTKLVPTFTALGLEYEAKPFEYVCKDCETVIEFVDIMALDPDEVMTVAQVLYEVQDGFPDFDGMLDVLLPSPKDRARFREEGLKFAELMRLFKHVSDHYTAIMGSLGESVGSKHI